jgi:trehalose 6-phosphate synthase
VREQQATDPAARRDGAAAPSALESPLVVASNRGPITFDRADDGTLRPDRGTGGLVTALAGALFESDATWLAAAMSDGDRSVAAEGSAVSVEPAGHMAFVDIPAERYTGYYDGMSNRVLWQLHHYLFDLSYLPSWDAGTRRIWADYRSVNASFAEALHRTRSGSPVYLVQDYHLSLVPRLLRELQPEARIAHFTHTPFAPPSYLRVLPQEIAEELLRGMLGADVLGFQAEQWAENFLLCVRDQVRDVHVDVRRRRVDIDGRTVLVRTYPVSLDPVPLRETATSADVRALRDEIVEWRGDAKLLLRVDRLELSKNIVRGFEAFELFLDEHPEWHRRVKFLALLPRSRTEIEEYRAYAARCLECADAINAKYGDHEWVPIQVHTDEHYRRAVAAYGVYDVMLVNPIFDGMNLVSMEGPLVNKRHGALILSRNAGAFARLGRYALAINPFDLAGTADAIAEALEMSAPERARRSRGLGRAVLTRNPVRWLTSQLRDIDAATGVAHELDEEVVQTDRPLDDHVSEAEELARGF